MAFDKSKRRLKIRRGIRAKISGTTDKPRFSVFKSNKALYVQLIDDAEGTTLLSNSTRKMGLTGNANLESAGSLGKKVAEEAKAKGIDSVVFDRSGYLYHGQIKALAEGAREGGLKF